MNLPTNLFELLGEEGETTSKKAPAPKSNTVAPQITTQSRPPKSGQDTRGKPSGTRGPSKPGSDPVDQDKRPRPTKRNDRKPPKGVEQRPDRKSGTGRGKEISKGGHGKGGWGVNVEEGAEGAPQEGADTTQPEPVVPELTEEERKEYEEKERKREEERQKEEKQMTLDEYLAKKKNVGLSLPQPRQPGEGVEDKQKKEWAALPVPKETVATSVPEAKAEFGVSKSEAVIADSQKKLQVLSDLGINVRVKDDARARRARARYEEEKRREDEQAKEKEAPKPVAQPNANSNLLAEDPRIKGQKKKKGNYKPPTKNEENFPALSTSAKSS